MNKKKDSSHNAIDKKQLQIFREFYKGKITEGEESIFIDELRKELINNINNNMSHLSTYQLQKNGVSPTTITYLKNKTDKMNIETLSKLNSQIIEIKQKVEMSA